MRFGVFSGALSAVGTQDEKSAQFKPISLRRLDTFAIGDPKQAITSNTMVASPMCSILFAPCLA